MSDTPPEHSHDPGWCQIRLKGHLGLRWAARFDGMTLTTSSTWSGAVAWPLAGRQGLQALTHHLAG